MGFCIYCNQSVADDTSCPKCHRTLTNKSEKKILGSIFTAKKKENQTDRWQNTYSKKLIFNNQPNVKQTRNMPQFPTTVMKTCLHCNEKKESSKLAAYNSSFYCHSCLTEKLSCPGCQQHFTESESRTAHNQQVWHSSCFKCNHCKSPLSPLFTVLDNEGNISCRVCQLKNNHEHVPSSGSVSTPLRSPLVSSRSTLTSSSKKSIMDSPRYAQYQNQRRASVLSAQNDLEQELKMNPLGSRSSCILPKPKEKRKKVVKRPCKECGLHVSKKEYRGLRIQTGELLCFHQNCLICNKCNQHFNTLEFCTDGTHFYHIECSDLSRQGSPVSDEDEAYPQTPSQSNTFFDIVSDSPTLTEPLQPFPKAKEIVKCNACDMSVTDTYLELANNIYHKECLLCAGCNQTVPTDRPLIKHDNKLYCGHCRYQQERPPLRITTSVSELPRRTSTAATPSDIFRSRKKVLPRLGGVRTCARCDESMPFSDTQPGPNASRWHKKCLRCAGCNKQMDSAAHMTTVKETGLCLVHCRDCLDDTPTPRFVRKV